VVSEVIQPWIFIRGFSFYESPLNRRLNGRRKESRTAGKMQPQTGRQMKQAKENKATRANDIITTNITAMRTTTN
jgi:hypothetical protein